MWSFQNFWCVNRRAVVFTACVSFFFITIQSFGNQWLLVASIHVSDSNMCCVDIWWGKLLQYIHLPEELGKTMLSLDMFCWTYYWMQCCLNRCNHLVLSELFHLNSSFANQCFDYIIRTKTWKTSRKNKARFLIQYNKN